MPGTKNVGFKKYKSKGASTNPDRPAPKKQEGKSMRSKYVCFSPFCHFFSFKQARYPAASYVQRKTFSRQERENRVPSNTCSNYNLGLQILGISLF